MKALSLSIGIIALLLIIVAFFCLVGRGEIALMIVIGALSAWVLFIRFGPEPEWIARLKE